MEAGPSRLAPLLQSGASISTEVIADEYIVVLRDDVPDVPTAARESQGEVLATWQHALKGYAVRIPAGQLQRLRGDARIRFVEANGRVSKVATQSPVPSWGLDRIDQVNLPLNNSYTYANTGAGVHAYIIDTGIRGTHNEFAGRMGAGFTVINDGNGTNDCDGHGTHVAGTVGGTAHGVAKGAILHPVRVLDCSGSGSFAGVISGINWVAANKISPAVANMSLGGGFNAGVNTATNNLVTAGVFTAVASGNSSADACGFSPASAASAMTVNSTTITDARSSFSNFGTCTDIFAPGSSIVSAYNTSNTATATLSGTSMASPHVAGAAALYLNANPSATPAQTTTALINGSTANKVTSPGTGSPNRLLNISFIGGGPPPNQPPTAAFTHSCSQSGTNMLCTFNGSSSSDPDGTVTAWRWSPPGQPVLMGVSVQYTFPPATTQTIVLMVTDNLGATNTLTRSISVPPINPTNQPPVANFTYTCAVSRGDQICTFDGSSSSDPDGTVTAWRWSPPGKPVRNGVSVRYAYDPGTTQTMVLRVTDNLGATTTITRTITIP